MEKRLSQFLKKWWAAITVMVLIFIFSSIPDRMQYPHVEQLELNWETIIRKSGHLLEYALLAIALLHGFDLDVGWKETAVILIIALLYAASDEFHQTFIPGRTGRLFDVGVDFTGAALGLVCWRKKIK